MNGLKKMILGAWTALPPGTARVLGHVASLLAGLLVALAIHYVLYRIGLPSKPFIYVAF
jgi:hypothetical protein